MNLKTKKTLKKMIVGTIGLISLLLLAVFIFLQQPMFGKLPEGERLERIRKSSNYKDGEFKNQSPTQMLMSDKSRIRVLWEFLFRRVVDLVPNENLPAIKTDLKKMDRHENVLIWMGHSSLYLQISGKRIVIDPVLVS